MTGRPMRICRGHMPGFSRIDRTGLGIFHLPGSSDGFTLTVLDPRARDWHARSGLGDVSFDRRRDLLEAVSAHAAISPLPQLTSRPAVTLRRRPDGVHVCADGDDRYEVRHVPVAGWTDRWKLYVPRPSDGRPVPSSVHRTLRQAAEYIHILREPTLPQKSSP